MTEDRMDTQTWVARGYNSLLTFEGTLLGCASSKRDVHTQHDTTHAPVGTRCSACRWFEVKIYRTIDLSYVVELTGHTLVDGERPRFRAEETKSPHWVIEMLTQRENDRRFIPLVSRKALAEAAAQDTGIENAYIHRVVA